MNTKINYFLPAVSFIYSILFFIFYFYPNFSLIINSVVDIKEILIYSTILASFIFLIVSIKKSFFVPKISFFSIFLYFLSFWVIINSTFAWFDSHNGKLFSEGLGTIIAGVSSGIILFLLFITSCIYIRKIESLRFQKIFSFLIYFFGILFLVFYIMGALEATGFLYKIENKINPVTQEDIKMEVKVDQSDFLQTIEKSTP